MSLKLWPISLDGYEQIFILADTPQKVDNKIDNIHQAMCKSVFLHYFLLFC